MFSSRAGSALGGMWSCTSSARSRDHSSAAPAAQTCAGFPVSSTVLNGATLELVNKLHLHSYRNSGQPYLVASQLEDILVPASSLDLMNGRCLDVSTGIVLTPKMCPLVHCALVPSTVSPRPFLRASLGALLLAVLTTANLPCFLEPVYRTILVSADVLTLTHSFPLFHSFVSVPREPLLKLR